MDYTKMTPQEMLAEFARMQEAVAAAKAAQAKAEAEAEAAKRAASGEFALSIGSQGGIVIRGITGRYPITLYREQVERIPTDFVERVRAFAVDNAVRLKGKTEDVEAYWTRIGLTDQEIHDRRTARDKK